MAGWEIFGLGFGVAILVVAWFVPAFREFLKSLFDYIARFWDWFLITTQDKPMSYLRYILFLFFVLFLVNALFSLVLGFQFFCIGSEDPYQPTSLGNGLVLWFLSGIQDSDYNGTNMTQIEYDSVVAGTLVSITSQTPDTDSKNFIKIKCNNNDPRFTFLGLDPLDYRLWVLLMIVTTLTSLYFKFRK